MKTDLRLMKRYMKINARKYFDIGRFGTTLIMIMAAMLVVGVSSSFAQGTLKFSGLLVDDANDNQLSMITLYQMNNGNGEDLLMVGQDIVEGDEWFVTKLEIGQKYLIKVISNNGSQSNITVDANVPEYYEDKRFKYAVKMDITGAKMDITHRMTDAAEDFIAFNSESNEGQVYYDNKAEAFIHRTNAKHGSLSGQGAIALNK